MDTAVYYVPVIEYEYGENIISEESADEAAGNEVSVDEAGVDEIPADKEPVAIVIEIPDKAIDIEETGETEKTEKTEETAETNATEKSGESEETEETQKTNETAAGIISEINPVMLAVIPGILVFLGGIIHFITKRKGG
jgi:hypothetical protein